MMKKQFLCVAAMLVAAALGGCSMYQQPQTIAHIKIVPPMTDHHNAVALAAATFNWDVCQEGPDEYRMIGNVRDRLEASPSRLFTVNIRFSEYGYSVEPNVELTEFRDVRGYVGREVNNYVRRVDEQLSEALSSSFVHGRHIPIRACSDRERAIVRTGV